MGPACDWTASYSPRPLKPSTLFQRMFPTWMVFIVTLLQNGQRLDDEELWEDVHDVMGAGHETTATTSAAVIYCVSAHPEVCWWQWCGMCVCVLCLGVFGVGVGVARFILCGTCTSYVPSSVLRACCHTLYLTRWRRVWQRSCAKCWAVGRPRLPT